MRLGKRRIELGSEVWSVVTQSWCGTLGLVLGGLEHLHDGFDPLHTETTLWIRNVQLGITSGTGGNRMLGK